ncbi:FAD binding domain-containing protein [Erwinia sp.]|uniref:FAD binding domain-containing protein n=1 Tax=Erwinia citreus TaxID=558 RepID=UPI003C751F9C
MNELTFSQAASAQDASKQRSHAGAEILAGGTTQLDLMKCGVLTPSTLIDVLNVPDMNRIDFSDQGIELGALVRMSQLANHPQCQASAQAIYGSLWQAASPQIRNMATLGGNLRQRTRCGYYRDPATFSNCNKRTPGSGCAAIEGINRNHAILGTSKQCIATYPGDFAVALTAFDATIVLTNSQGEQRRVSIHDFYKLPGDTPHIEHDLRDDEIISAITLPPESLLPLRQSHYLKVRDRASYEFAAASAAVGLVLQGEVISQVHIALGGVATRPWRARNVEQALIGKRFDEKTLADAAQLVVEGAQAQTHNQFKVTLAPRVITRALLVAGGRA